jgi:putative DNA primase/helicase
MTDLLRTGEIHARLGAAWPNLLARLGIGETFLRLKKAGPCPACGGRDRYVFDNRRQRGDFFCRHCGAGTGFDLLMRVRGWDFKEARKQVIEAAGLAMSEAPLSPARPPVPTQAARPTQRVLSLLRESCQVADCTDAVTYLERRGLWPLPERCALRAHPSVAYFADGQRIGRFPALVAPIRDRAGELVSAHVTYLHAGQKLSSHEPRKILSPLAGRTGCAVQLSPAVDTLGVAEGIETALAAQRQTGTATWAALNTSLLAKFEPPPSVARVVIFADRDEPGLQAASKLADRLQDCVAFEIAPPRGAAKDWAETLEHSR